MTAYENGVFRHSGQPSRNERIRALAQAMDAGRSLDDVAREWGIKRSTLNNYTSAARLLMKPTVTVQPEENPRKKYGNLPLESGHEISMRSLWSGLERWCGLS